MRSSSRSTTLRPRPQLPVQSAHTGFKFRREGKYLIAAGSTREDGQEAFSPTLYISIAGGKAWATRHPVDGKFRDRHDAAAAALDHGIQIIALEVKDTLPPQEPLPPSVDVERMSPAPRLMHF